MSERAADVSQDINSRIAARVRALRAGQGLTLDALAEKCDVSRSMISLVERGESSPTAVVLEKISSLKKTGISILFASHDPDHAFLTSQRVLLLAEGRALEIGPPAQVIRADSLKRLYGVSVDVLPLAGGRHTCLPELR